MPRLSSSTSVPETHLRPSFSWMTCGARPRPVCGLATLLLLLRALLEGPASRPGGALGRPLERTRARRAAQRDICMPLLRAAASTPLPARPPPVLSMCVALIFWCAARPDRAGAAPGPFDVVSPSFTHCTDSGARAAACCVLARLCLAATRAPCTLRQLTVHGQRMHGRGIHLTELGIHNSELVVALLLQELLQLLGQLAVHLQAGV
jgi:hypothetical protein